MKRLLFLLVVFFLLAGVSACSAKKPPTQSAVRGNGVIRTLQDLSHFFGKKNLPGFMSLLSDNYKDRQALSASISAVFAKYEIVRFTVQYARMVITIDEQGTPRASFNWDSEWQTAGGSVEKNSGRATFVFDPRDSRLVSIEGKVPFIPQPVELPRKP